MEDFFTVIEAAKERMPKAGAPFLSFLEQQENFVIAIDFVASHREDVTLLVLKSDGASAHHFQEIAIQAYESVWFGYFDYLKEAFPDQPIQPASDFFVHNIARFYFNTLVEFLRQDLSHDEMLAHAVELVRYAQGGVRGLLTPEQ